MMIVNSGQTPTRTAAFTLIELLVVIAIIAILAAILFPVFTQTREKARQTACLSNIKQIGTGLMMYTQDYDECFPTQEAVQIDTYATSNKQSWIVAVQPYIKSWAVFLCPAAQPITGGAAPTGNSNTGYKVNGVLVGVPAVTSRYPAVPVSNIISPASLIFLHEFSLSSHQSQLSPAPATGLTGSYQYWLGANAKALTTERFDYLHSGGGSLLFADGHAKWRSLDAICTRDFGLNTDTCGLASVQESINSSGSIYAGKDKDPNLIR